jgi:hypothetical protein
VRVTAAMRAINRSTVVRVQVTPPGVGTPRLSNAGASACRDVTPSPRGRSTSNNNRCAARSAATLRATAAAPLSGPTVGR